MNEPHFQGHFPGTPIMPGVTIVEAMAQTAAVMVGATLGLTDGNLLIYFMSIDGCKFRRKVVPGDLLRMQVTTTRGKPGGKVWRFKGVATVDGEMAAEAEFTAMMDIAGPEMTAPVIHPSAVIEAGAQIGPGCVIGPFCHVGADVVLARGRDAEIACRDHRRYPYRRP